jgi:hypothetical protein
MTKYSVFFNYIIGFMTGTVLTLICINMEPMNRFFVAFTISTIVTYILLTIDQRVSNEH